MGAMQRLRGSGFALVAVVACACSRFDEGTTLGADGGPAEAGNGASAGKIICAGTFCQEGQVCCITSDPGGFVSAACTAKDACVHDHYDCDDTSDCAAGLVCCASTNGGSYFWASAACGPPCTGSQRQLCKSSSECGGGSCAPNPEGLEPPGLSACK